MADGEAGKVPVLECVSGAYRFFIENVMGLLPACLVVAAVAGLSPLMAGAIAGSGQINFPLMMGAVILNVVTGTVLTAAVLRRAIRGEASPAVAFGADELRLVGVAFSLALLFMPLAILFSLVLSVVVVGRLAASGEQLAGLLTNPDAFADALQRALSPTEQFLFSLFVMILMCAALYVSVRLFLVNAGTSGEKRIVIFQTWAWTRGNFFRVLAAMLLVLLPCSLIANLLTSIVQAPLEDRTAAQLGAVALYVIGAVQGFIIALTNIPAVALGAILYKGLRPPDFVAK